jgi:hypothetical protein
MTGGRFERYQSQTSNSYEHYQILIESTRHDQKLKTAKDTSLCVNLFDQSLPAKASFFHNFLTFARRL